MKDIVHRDRFFRRSLMTLPITLPAFLMDRSSVQVRRVPCRERGMRRGTRREDGEVARFVLAGWQPTGGRIGLPAATKSSGDEWLSHERDPRHRE